MFSGSQKIGEYMLEMTCSVSPEQYDVFDSKGNQVGYLRMRWGCFRADYPECGGETVYYTEEPNGFGNFEDHERDHFLSEAIFAIDQRVKRVAEADNPLPGQ